MTVDGSDASAPPPAANPPVRRPGRRRSPGALGFVWESLVMGWRWLTRMRTALYLLGALALLTLVATFVPQENNVPTTVAAWRTGSGGPGRLPAQALDALGAFDVYGAPLFLALLLLLVLSLTACLVPRIRAWVRLVRRSRPPLVRHLGAAPLEATLRTDMEPAAVVDRADALLAERRWRRRRSEGEPGTVTQVAGEKGLWSREGGSLLFHLSFYVLLLSIVLGQLVTFEGQRGVVEGEPGFADTAVSYWTYRPGRWFGEDDHRGWQLHLDAFEVDWVRDPLAPGAGQPTVFRSDVTITPRDGEPYEAVIDSNRPLTVEGMKVTQLDWGYAPRVVIEVDGEVVHDAFLVTQTGDAGMYRAAAKAPSAEPDVGLDVFFWPYAPDGENGRPVTTGAPWDDAPLLLYQQYRGDLQLGATQQTMNELDTTQLESAGGAYLRLGQTIEVDGVTVSFPELRRWVGYQVSDRPQLPWLLFGAALLVAGLITALYAYRRRVWVLAVRYDEGGPTLVTVAGRAFQRPDVFEAEHAALVDALTAAIGDGRAPDAGPGAPPGPDVAPLAGTDDAVPQTPTEVPGR